MQQPERTATHNEALKHCFYIVYLNEHFIKHWTMPLFNVLKTEITLIVRTNVNDTRFTGVIHLDHTQSLSGAHRDRGCLEIREDGRCVGGVSGISCRDYFKTVVYGALMTLWSLLSQCDRDCGITADGMYFLSKLRSLAVVARLASLATQLMQLWC